MLFKWFSFPPKLTKLMQSIRFITVCKERKVKIHSNSHQYSYVYGHNRFLSSFFKTDIKEYSQKPFCLKISISYIMIQFLVYVVAFDVTKKHITVKVNVLTTTWTRTAPPPFCTHIHNPPTEWMNTYMCNKYTGR